MTAVIDRGSVAGLPRPGTGAGLAAPHVCFVSMNIYPVLSGSTTIQFVGGGEVQQAVIAKALVADGFRVSVLTGDYGQPEQVDCDGVRVLRVPSVGKRGVKGLRFLHPMMTDIVAGLERLDPDIVYFRIAGARAAAAAWYAWRRNKRFVYACASDREFQGRKISQLPWRDYMLFRTALRSADAVLVQNETQRELLKTRLGRESLVTPNCYSEPGARRVQPGGPILWVGVFKPIKRPDLFIELARRHPDKSFVMVGGADRLNDPDEVYFSRMREAAAACPNLRFVGYVPFSQVGEYFDRASLLVNTSDLEGFPNTFLQAWIRGMPSLSFVAPQVTAGQSGTIACRDIDDLSTRVAGLSGDHAAWRRASDDCTVHFQQHHLIETVLRTYREFFDALRPREGWA